MNRKSTRLKDFYGKKIFVGDIVYFRNGEKGIVKEDIDGDYYVVTDDGFAIGIDEYKIEMLNIERASNEA